MDIRRLSDFIEDIYRSDVPLQLLQQSRMVNVSQMQGARATYMEYVAERLFFPSCKILEIGTWMGLGSTTLWLRHLPADSQLVCLDRWEAYVSEKDLADEENSYSAMNGLSRTALNVSLNVIESSRERNVVVIKGRSSQALELLKEESFDFVYVDGSHYYADVKADLQIAKRLVRQGGILCGDDLELNPNPYMIEFGSFRKPCWWLTW